MNSYNLQSSSTLFSAASRPSTLAFTPRGSVASFPPRKQRTVPGAVPSFPAKSALVADERLLVASCSRPMQARPGPEVWNGDRRMDRNTFVEANSGMRDVPVWLKSLRLHKYADVFARLTYEEMLELDEDALVAMNITKGARNKILLNLSKLKNRQGDLRQFYQKLLDKPDSLLEVLTDVANMLIMPIKPVDDRNASQWAAAGLQEVLTMPVEDGDLCSEFVKLLALAYQTLLSLNFRRSTNEECSMVFSHILDRCLTHEAFAPWQKRIMSCWKLQISSIYKPTFSNLKRWKRLKKNLVFRKGVTANFSSVPLDWTPDARAVPFEPAVRRGSFEGSMYPASPTTTGSGSPLSIGRNLSTTSLASGSSGSQSSNDEEQELDLRLERLCLSVTEHALSENFERNSIF